jgi:cysteine dioxygenase
MTFAEAVKEIILEAERAAERPTPGSLAGIVARQAERYIDRVRFDPAQYVRHPVLLHDDWEVMIIGWEAGQVTPIHDHRGILGGMAMLTGSLLEERYTTPGGKLNLADSRVRPEGDLCDIGPTALHRLTPRTHAVSLHIYRPPLRTMGIWDDSGLVEIRGSQFDVGDEVLARAVARTAPARC